MFSLQHFEAIVFGYVGVLLSNGSKSFQHVCSYHFRKALWMLCFHIQGAHTLTHTDTHTHRLWSSTIIPRNLVLVLCYVWPCCLTHTYFIMTHYYTVWSLSSSLASGSRSRAFLHVICYWGSSIQRCSSVFFFSTKAAPNIAPSLELLVFSAPFPPTPHLLQVLSMGHSWSKHHVVHIILRQNSLQQAQVVC